MAFAASNTSSTTRPVSQVGFANPNYGDLPFSMPVMPTPAAVSNTLTTIQTLYVDNPKAYFESQRVKADAGDREARYEVGLMYSKGVGAAAVDHQQAIKYYTLAADEGHIAASYCLGIMYSNTKEIKEDMKLAVKYFNLADQGGYIDASYNLGFIYEHGKGVKANKDYAAGYYKQAADNGHVSACVNLGLIYRSQKDYDNAFNYLKQAADKGHSTAQYVVSKLLKKGKGCQINLDESKRYLKLAADQNHAKALKKIGK